MKLKQAISEGRRKGRGRKAFWIILLAVGVVALGSVLAGGRRHREAFSAAGIEHALKGLDTSSEQRAMISAVLERVEPEQRRMKAERERLQRELTVALGSDELDAAAIDRLGEQASALAARAVERGIEVAVEVSAALTPGQRQQLVERWSERH